EDVAGERVVDEAVGMGKELAREPGAREPEEDEKPGEHAEDSEGQRPGLGEERAANRAWHAGRGASRPSARRLRNRARRERRHLRLHVHHRSSRSVRTTPLPLTVGKHVSLSREGKKSRKPTPAQVWPGRLEVERRARMRRRTTPLRSSRFDVRLSRPGLEHAVRDLAETLGGGDALRRIRRGHRKSVRREEPLEERDRVVDGDVLVSVDVAAGDAAWLVRASEEPEEDRERVREIDVLISVAVPAPEVGDVLAGTVDEAGRSAERDRVSPRGGAIVV